MRQKNIRTECGTGSRRRIASECGWKRKQLVTLKTLEDIIKHYINCRRDKARKELKRFHDQPSLVQAIKIAALAKDENDKRQKHQRRQPKTSLKQSARILIESASQIRSCRSFDKDLHPLVERRIGNKRIDRINELTVYDTALRIGAKRGLYPKLIYLHAGTRAGAEKLKLALDLTYDDKSKSITKKELPDEFKVLKPYEIEDCLCIFKDKFSSLKT
jgi:hypothetical protein